MNQVLPPDSPNVRGNCAQPTHDSVPSSWAARLGAYVTDLSCVLLPAVGFAAISGRWWVALVVAVGVFCALTLTRAFLGHTLGTVLTGTRAVRADRVSPPGFLRQLGRSLILLLLHALPPAPLVCVLFTREGQDWLDRLFGTALVVETGLSQVNAGVEVPAVASSPAVATSASVTDPVLPSVSAGQLPLSSEASLTRSRVTAAREHAPQQTPPPSQAATAVPTPTAPAQPTSPASATPSLSGTPVLPSSKTSNGETPSSAETSAVLSAPRPSAAPAHASTPASLPARVASATPAPASPLSESPSTRDGAPTMLLPTLTPSENPPTPAVLPSSFRVLAEGRDDQGAPSCASSWQPQAEVAHNNTPAPSTRQRDSRIPHAPQPASRVSSSASPEEAAPVSWGAEPPTTPGLWLVVDSGQRERVDTTLVIGRSPSSSDPRARQVVIPDTSRTLSRTHLCIGPTKTGAWVEDSFSANGTRLRAPSGRTVALPRGKRIEVPVGTIVIAGERELTVVSDAPR